MRRRAALAAILLAIGMMAGCGAVEPTVPDGAGSDPPGSPGSTGRSATTLPPVASDLVLQIRTGGGFVAPRTRFGTVPELTLYADGEVVQLGAVAAIYPGPALPPLFTGRVSDHDVRTAVAAARDAGVTRSADLGQPTVTDQATTRIILVDEGTTYRVDAYALGMEDGHGLTPKQRDDRRRLVDLQRRLEELAATAATEPYLAPAVSVLVTPAREGKDAVLPEVTPDVADWPLGDLATGGAEQLGGRCLGFTGRGAERVLAAASDARSNTRWRSGGTTWELTFRPELRGMTPCDERVSP